MFSLPLICINRSSRARCFSPSLHHCSQQENGAVWHISGCCVIDCVGFFKCRWQQKHGHACLGHFDVQDSAIRIIPPRLGSAGRTRLETRRSFRLIRRHKVGCYYFCVADVSDLLKIDTRETKHVGRVGKRQISQCEISLSDRDSSCVCRLVSNLHAVEIKCDPFAFQTRVTPSELLRNKNVNEVVGIFSTALLSCQCSHSFSSFFA